MRVKAVQIAEELGISRATVSLALNNKPGVSERTRQEILQCQERLLREGEEKKKEISFVKKGLIKVIVASKGLKIGFDSGMDLWTDVLAVFQREAQKRGYQISVTYLDIRYDSLDQLIYECSGKEISGVILQATELNAEDIEQFQKIQKPMVIYDNESRNLTRHCVVADNRLGVEHAVKYLFERNYTDIVYLGTDMELYNFQQRRSGFSGTLLEYNRNPYETGRMLMLSTTIEGVYHDMKEYLENHKLPEAFLSENYQVTIGLMRALKEKRIQVPEDVAVIGVDTLPSYMTGDCQVTAVRIPHTERAVLTVMLLEKEIEEQSKTKSRIMTDCSLVEGESVKTRI